MRKNIKRIGALVAIGMFVLIMIVPAPSAQEWGTSYNCGTSMTIVVDYDNDADDEVFAVFHDGKVNSDPPGEELFRIQEDGNVGVGTPEPTERLDVNGKARIRNLPQDNTLSDIVGADADGVLHVRDVSTIGILPDAWYSTSSGSPPSDINDDIYTNGNVGIGTADPATTLDVNGGLATNTVTVTGDYSPTGTDYTVFVDANANHVTINLPLAGEVPGQILVLKRTDANPSNRVVIYGGGDDTIDGKPQLGMNRRSISYTIQSNGSDWFIINSYRLIRNEYGGTPGR